MADYGQNVPQSSSTWTRWFGVLFVAVAVAGVLLLIVGVARITSSPQLVVGVTSANRVALVTEALLLGACLAALWVTHEPRLRAGLAFQVGAVIGSGIGGLLSLEPMAAPTNSALIDATASLAVLSSLLNLSSLIFISYGIADWQQSDRVAIRIQVALTLVLGTLMLVDLVVTRQVPSAQLLPAPDLVSAYCGFAAVFVVLARPACWAARPVTIAYLTIGRLILLLYGTILFRDFSFSSAVVRLQVLYGLTIGATIMFTLGVLLLAQSARLARVRP